VVEFGVGLDDPAQRVAVHQRHHHVANNQVRPDLPRLREPLQSVAGLGDVVVLAEDALQIVSQVGVVVHDEYGRRIGRSLGPAGWNGRGRGIAGRPFAVERQIRPRFEVAFHRRHDLFRLQMRRALPEGDDEHRAGAHFAFNGDATAV